MDQRTQGLAAEISFAGCVASQGLGISWPAGDNEKYDLVVQGKSGKLYRVQIKSTNNKRGCSFYVHFTHGHKVRKTYTKKDVEVLAVFLPYQDHYEDIFTPGVYLIPINKIKTPKGIFYPPGKGRCPNWVSKFEKYRDNWGIFK